PHVCGEAEAGGGASPGAPPPFNYAEGGKPPPVSHDFLRKPGFKLIIFPTSPLLAATAAMRTVLAQIRADGTPVNALPDLVPFNEFLDFIGLPDVQDVERRFCVLDEGARPSPWLPKEGLRWGRSSRRRAGAPSWRTKSSRRPRRRPLRSACR